MHTLVVMRHAKSAYPGGVPDHDRPLADRGLRDAVLAGDWLRSSQPPVDHILTSTAARALQTADTLALPAGRSQRGEIYDAWPDLILECIQQIPEEATTLLVIGHAPGIPCLAADLAGPDSDPVALQQVTQRYPTSALAVLTVGCPWAELTTGRARLAALHIPRE